MALRFVVAFACLTAALANPLGTYGGLPFNAGFYGAGIPINAGYGAGIPINAGYGAGIPINAGYGIVGSPCAPPPCAPPPCPPPVKIVEQPVAQPVVQEVAVPVPQAVPITVPNPTFLDSNTRITTVSGSNGGEVQSTTTGSWDPSGPLPAAHGAALVNANPWAFTAPQYPTLSPIFYGNSLFGTLA